MEMIKTDKGVFVMGDVWDYKLSKAEMAWELALRVMPGTPQVTGKWTEESYLEHAQETLKQSYDVIDAVFTADKVR